MNIWHINPAFFWHICYPAVNTSDSGTPGMEACINYPAYFGIKAIHTCQIPAHAGKLKVI
jgi:hypothetical protein